MDEKIVYIHGCVHGPGKASPDEVTIPGDQMTQSELDALELNNVPITVEHPPNRVYVKDTPDLVCGKIMHTVRDKDGSKYVLGWLSTATPAGEEAYKRLKAGELGLSLGHRYEEVRYSDTKELYSRGFEPDHVSLCKNPRRPGCWIKIAGAAPPPTEAYLNQESYTQRNASAPVQSAASSTGFASPTQTFAPSAKMADAQAPAPSAATQAPAQPGGSAPMDTSSPVSDPTHTMLMKAAEEVKYHRERDAELTAKFNEMQAQMATLAREREALIKEREDAKQRAMEAEQKKAEKATKTIAEVFKGLKKLGVVTEDGEFTQDALMRAQFPNGVKSEEDVGRVRALERFEMIACAAAERDEAVQKYEELRQRVFSKDAPPDAAPKRLRADSAVSSSFQPSVPATPAAPAQSTSFQDFQSKFGGRKPFTPDRLFSPQGTADFERLVAKSTARNHNTFWQEPPEFRGQSAGPAVRAPWDQ